MDGRRKIGAEIELMKQLQELDGNESSKALLEDHLRSTIIHYTTLYGATREMRAIIVFAVMFAISMLLALGGYIAHTVVQDGPYAWIGDTVLAIGIGSVIPAVLLLGHAVWKDLQASKAKKP